MICFLLTHFPVLFRIGSETMDTTYGFRQRKSVQPEKRRGQGGGRGGRGSSRPQFFEDTSNSQGPPQPQPYGMNYGQPPYGYEGTGGYPPQPPQQQSLYPGRELFQFQDPVANMAMQYGTSLADQGKEYVHKNLEKYVATSKLKYYFAVDTTYVGKKLALLFFPYSHANWSIQYNQDTPVAPRYDTNAPDLYIPVMAFVTYILVAGVVMGTQNRFKPEQIGGQASTALVWLIMELVATLLSLYVTNLNKHVTYTDCLAYSGYKFVGMVFSLLAGLVFRVAGYYLTLLWFGAAISFFMIRTLRQKILPHAASEGNLGGTKRSLYLILAIAVFQPFFMWWLSSHVMFGHKA